TRLRTSNRMPIGSPGSAGEEVRPFQKESNMKKGSILSVFVLLLTALKALAQFAPSTTDMWDISQGTILILSSDLDSALSSPHPYDMRDIFGGSFGDYQPEKGN